VKGSPRQTLLRKLRRHRCGRDNCATPPRATLRNVPIAIDVKDARGVSLYSQRRPRDSPRDSSSVPPACAATGRSHGSTTRFPRALAQKRGRPGLGRWPAIAKRRSRRLRSFGAHEIERSDQRNPVAEGTVRQPLSRRPAGTRSWYGLAVRGTRIAGRQVARSCRAFPGGRLDSIFRSSSSAIRGALGCGSARRPTAAGMTLKASAADPREIADAPADYAASPAAAPAPR